MENLIDGLIAVAVMLSIFGGVWGIIFFAGRTKSQQLKEKRLIVEAEARKAEAEMQLQQQASAPPPPLPVDANAAPVLAIKLPEPYRQQALAIISQIQDAPPELDARSSYLLKETLTQFLPDTLRGYLGLSQSARARLQAQGQDAETLMGEQLTLMQQGIDEALRLDHAAADRLLVQGRFLRERFSKVEMLDPAPFGDINLDKQAEKVRTR